MPRIARPRVQEDGHPAAEKRFVSRKSAAAEPLDDVERQFLEPVARYLAILREWSLERLSDGTGTVLPKHPGRAAPGSNLPRKPLRGVRRSCTSVFHPKNKNRD